ncbi:MULTISPECIES: ABC transporter ATP-binding protein [unclassified Rhizobium]|uniref:dipeptide ABC transporter ATP-binding protein n=1 Tax=unclassified Rhizobium TaxID=2613769 RepID=UPI0006F7A6C0|nr:MULTISPECIES: ABC transporter ATP-binding protein [unclassified Rhizobium]KQV41707.1 ABC transporter ATP-binding protein [Rhizobium sp. Root1212]KRD32223.1 ABC transporter ATP-binding protein [Rhizobium sp. Root268]
MSTFGKPVLDVRDLHVSYSQGDSRTTVVHGVSFSVQPGEVVALVGESGSGKTSTAQAVIGLLPANGRLESGSIRLNGEDISRWSAKRLRNIRGAVVSLIPQDPGNSLNPVLTVGAQVREILELHGRIDRRDADRRVIELLAHVGLTDPELRVRQYPHELSGGMKQRVLIAIAIALRPALIIADEPTSALDVTVQRRILDLIDDLRREYGTAVLFVTHDLGVAADRSDRIIVLQGGRIQEQGETAAVLAAPESAYTRKLLSDVPSLIIAQPRPAVEASRAPAVVVRNLVQDFDLPGGRTYRAVDDVSFTVARGTTHAIVGESGSGKTTTIRAIAGFQKPTSGQTLIDDFDVGSLKSGSLRQFRRKVQLVYQNPWGSLDPRQTVRAIVEEPLLNFEPIGRAAREAQVTAIIERVGLPAGILSRLPHALSGGQRQRVAIARALVLEPEIVVLDEAVSALDVTVQAQILALLAQLQRDLGLTYVFVSHDLAVVRQIADTVSVLQNGRQVDHGPVEQVFNAPSSAYTRELIAAIPGRKLPRATALSTGSIS